MIATSDVQERVNEARRCLSLALHELDNLEAADTTRGNLAALALAASLAWDGTWLLKQMRDEAIRSMSAVPGGGA
jgi:hypothetical protein